MRIEFKDPKSLTPYVKNAKIHTPEQIDDIAGQISAFGFDQPIVVDKNNVIIKGHGRREAAIKLNLSEVPVVVAEHLDEYQAMAARIADNKIARDTDVDQDKLKFDLGTLSLRDFNMKLTGFKPMELKKFELDTVIRPEIIGTPPAGPRNVIEESPTPPPPPEQGEHEFAPDVTETKSDGEGGSFFMDRNPVIQYNIIFDDEEQQKKWHEFLAHLKVKYPSEETLAKRLMLFLAEVDLS